MMRFIVQVEENLPEEDKAVQELLDKLTKLIHKSHLNHQISYITND